MVLQDQVVWSAEFLPEGTIPDRFADATPSGIENAVIRATVDRYLEHFWEAAEAGIAPLFSGRSGQWKSYGAAVIARFARHQKLPTRFVECGPWFMRAEALFYQPEGPREIAELTAMPFVVLDDITQVAPGTRPADIMANILASRFAAQRPTLVTLNVALADEAALTKLAAKYRVDFARRLWHGSQGYRAVV